MTTCFYLHLFWYRTENILSSCKRTVFISLTLWSFYKIHFIEFPGVKTATKIKCTRIREVLYLLEDTVVLVTSSESAFYS